MTKNDGYLKKSRSGLCLIIYPPLFFFLLWTSWIFTNHIRGFTGNDTCFTQPLIFFKSIRSSFVLHSLQNGRKKTPTHQADYSAVIFLQILSKKKNLQFTVLTNITEKYQTQFVFISLQLVRKKYFLIDPKSSHMYTLYSRLKFEMLEIVS